MPLVWCSNGRISVTALGLFCLALLSGCVTETTGDVVYEEASPRERAQSLVDLASGYIDTGNYSQAKRQLQRAEQIDSRQWQIHDLLGQIYQREGDYDLAEQSFRRAVRLAPNNARARNDFGVFLYQQGRYEDAVEQLERAVRDTDSPNRASAYENLGLAALATGDQTLARNAFGRAIMLDDRRPLALLRLAELSYAEADYTEAGAYYTRFRELARQTPRSLLLGIRLARAVRNEDAEASFALQLRNMFPLSDEYRLYQEMTLEQ